MENAGIVRSAEAARVATAGWIAVLLFCVAQVFSTIDRGMVALVIDPIRADLGVTEIQIALLQGFAFAVFYVTAGLPIGMLADRVNRRRLLIFGITVWSLATIAGGYARNFGEMFASRLFLGVGEAVLAPCAVTMISDYFEANKRGRPMSVYVLGTMVAFGIGSLVAGYILELAPKGVFDFITPLRGLPPWRIAFILLGACGLFVALAMFFLREPPRRTVATGTQSAETLRTTLTRFGLQWRLYLPLYAALSLFAMGASVATGWGAVLLTRVFGFDPANAGKSLGSAKILWAVAGALLASVLVDRVARRFGTAGKIRLAAAVTLIAIPSCLAVMTHMPWLAIALIAQVTFATAIFGTTMLSVITEVAPANARGVAVALYAFVMTMIGGSLGPLAVATLTERVFQSPLAVGKSMVVVGVVAFGVSALLSVIAARALQTPRVADRLDH
jgi:MFS family permease